jgi:hypothetical protein
VRRFQTKGEDVYKIFTGVITVFADAADLFAMAAHVLICLLNEEVQFFDLFPYFRCDTNDVMQFMTARGECLFQKKKNLTKREGIPAVIFLESEVGSHVHREISLRPKFAVRNREKISNTSLGSPKGK